MNLFHKESDMQCWNCKILLNHNEIKWNERKPVIFGSTLGATTILTNQYREMLKGMGYEKGQAPEISVFGVHKFEWRGLCPKCKEPQCMFWAGQDSIKNNKEKPRPHEPFFCPYCNERIIRENQVWYSYRILEDQQLIEYLVTLCFNCKKEIVYPFNYDLDRGFID